MTRRPRDEDIDLFGEKEKEKQHNGEYGAVRAGGKQYLLGYRKVDGGVVLGKVKLRWREALKVLSARVKKTQKKKAKSYL